MQSGSQTPDLEVPNRTSNQPLAPLRIVIYLSLTCSHMIFCLFSLDGYVIRATAPRATDAVETIVFVGDPVCLVYYPSAYCLYVLFGACY